MKDTKCLGLKSVINLSVRYLLMLACLLKSLQLAVILLFMRYRIVYFSCCHDIVYIGM